MRKKRIRKTPKPSVNNVDFRGQKTMSLYTRKGEKITFSNLNYGTDLNKKTAE